MALSQEEERQRGKLFAAAWRGEFDEVKSLLDSGSLYIDVADDNGVTALRFAAQFGHIEIAR